MSKSWYRALPGSIVSAVSHLCTNGVVAQRKERDAERHRVRQKDRHKNRERDTHTHRKWKTDTRWGQKKRKRHK
jgi:hypothetical protein